MPPAKRVTHVPHGTAAGYARHVNAGEPPCDACVRAKEQQQWESEGKTLAHKYQRLEEIHSFVGDLLADWTRQAACNGRDAIFDLTYKKNNMPGVQNAARLAADICADCPVLNECRQAGDARETWTDTHGFLAGESAGNRIRRRQEAARRAQEEAAA